MNIGAWIEWDKWLSTVEIKTLAHVHLRDGSLMHAIVVMIVPFA